jgi:hypothetical protein
MGTPSHELSSWDHAVVSWRLKWQRVEETKETRINTGAG